jgi:hypothetical protein
MNQTDYETALRAEIAAIRRIVAALDTVDPAVQERIIRYLVDRYGEAKTPCRDA